MHDQVRLDKNTVLKQKIPFVMVTGCTVNGLKEEIQINSKNDFSN
jgi:hypothetical protein